MPILWVVHLGFLPHKRIWFYSMYTASSPFSGSLGPARHVVYSRLVLRGKSHVQRTQLVHRECAGCLARTRRAAVMLVGSIPFRSDGSQSFACVWTVRLQDFLVVRKDSGGVVKTEQMYPCSQLNLCILRSYTSKARYLWTHLQFLRRACYWFASDPRHLQWKIASFYAIYYVSLVCQTLCIILFHIIFCFSWLVMSMSV